MVIHQAKKWIGYLEHRNEYLIGVYNANTGKGGYTIFSSIINRHYPWRNFNGMPWCVTFVHAIYIEALGKEDAKKLLGKPHPGSKVLARRMKRSGRLRNFDYIPNPGDIIFLSNDNSNVISHCGIVVGVEDNTVVSIEGNTVDPSGTFDKRVGGAVAERRRPLNDSKIVCYGQIDK